MGGRGLSAFVISNARCRLATWWSAKRFAGSVEGTSGARLLTSWRPHIILVLLAGLIYSARLGCPLLEPEEARYAEIPRQMLAHGRWLMPILHGEDYLQKPPLLYWLIMAGYQVFGVHDWAARLVPSLAGILVVLATHGWALRTVGPRAALASGILLCLSPKFLYLSGMVAMDSLLCLWVVAGLASGHLAQAPAGGSPRERLGVAWWLLSALCCGLGVMTKGPVAAVLILGPLMAWPFLESRAAPIPPRWWLGYLGVVLLVSGPWYLAISLRAAHAVGEFFWLHHVVRFLAPFDHEKPAWFYLPGVFIGMLPWTLLLFPLLPYLCRRWARRRPTGLGFFLLAFVWCLTFFSMSGCKRPAYILPALPVLALVFGTFLARAVREASCPRTPRRSMGIVWTFAAGVTTVVLFMATQAVFHGYHRKFGLRAEVLPHVAQAKGMPVVCYPKRWDSVSFYLGRDVESFGRDRRDQMMMQLQGRETLLFVKNDGAFVELMRALPPDLVFLPSGLQESNVKAGTVRPGK